MKEFFDSDAWTVYSDSVSRDDTLKNGNRFLIGNGYMGYRGTIDEASKDDMTALIVNGIYDKNGDGWREPINFPNPLKTLLYIDREVLSIHDSEKCVKHSQAVHFRYGIYARETVWEKQGAKIRLSSQRFVSMNNPHLMVQKYSVKSNKKIQVSLLSGIDSDVHDFYGPHFEIVNQKTAILDEKDGRSGMNAEVFCEAKSLEKSIPFLLFKGISVNTKNTYRMSEENASLPGSLNGVRINCFLEPEQEIELVSFVLVHTALDYVPERQIFSKKDIETLQNELHALQNQSYEVALEAHMKKWDAIWETGDVRIINDDEAQKALRYSLYHLQSIAPRTERILSIPARGLSGQTYKGAIFWDTELFMLPYFLAVDPQVARKCIQYRIKTLDGARRKASEYGYAGAFYAWESQDTGDDACSDYNVIDVFTKRPVKTYFKDKQIHISAAIVYAIEQYIENTGDTSILYEGAFEVIVECARFYASRIVYIPYKKRYEMHDVLGPDEYHERVNNNVYTNRMVAYTIQSALDHIKMIKNAHDEKLKAVLDFLRIEDDIPLFEDILENLYLPDFIDVENELLEEKDILIPQFDDYFNLEDTSIEVLKKRLLDPQEYWGGANGVASHTQIIKQADTIVLMNLFPELYNEEIKKKNFDYYSQRTEHGSSLSACMYALLACQLKNPSWAYPFFRKTAEVDLLGESKQFAGLVYIGGTHPAANGGAWLSVVKGFCGFNVKNGTIEIKPSLPSHWKEVSFNAEVLGVRYTIKVRQEGYTICKI